MGRQADRRGNGAAPERLSPGPTRQVPGCRTMSAVLPAAAARVPRLAVGGERPCRERCRPPSSTTSTNTPADPIWTPSCRFAAGWPLIATGALGAKPDLVTPGRVCDIPPYSGRSPSRADDNEVALLLWFEVAYNDLSP